MSFSEQLEELLKQPNTVQPVGKRGGDWNFTQEHAPHDPDTRTITATTKSELLTEDDWTQFVIDNGGAVAPGYRVRLVEMRHNSHAWQRNGQGEDATTAGSWFYKFVVEPVIGQARIDELLKLVKRRKSSRGESFGAGVFRQLYGDTQLGKVDGDGTEGIVDQFVSSVEKGAKEFKRLSRTRSLGIVSLAMLGDCGEGNQSQNGRNMWRTELTVTEQYRLLRRLLLFAIDTYAPLVEQVTLDVVNGNHDEVQRFQNTRADDGHATESAIALMDALAMNPAAYGHVKVFVPNKDESYITRESGSSVVTMAHGHQWGRGKSMAWWSGQSFNLQAPGASQFLFHGHEHEFSVQSKRDRVVVCVPSFESESTWWRHKTGDVGKRGSLVLTTNEGEFADMSVI